MNQPANLICQLEQIEKIGSLLHSHRLHQAIDRIRTPEPRLISKAAGKEALSEFGYRPPDRDAA